MCTVRTQTVCVTWSCCLFYLECIGFVTLYELRADSQIIIIIIIIIIIMAGACRSTRGL